MRRYIRLVAAILSFIVLVVLFSALVLPTNVGAVSWSWSNTPTVASANPIPYAGTGMCYATFQKKVVAGEPLQQDICVTGGESVRYGTYFSHNSLAHVVGFGNESKMYPLGSVCNGYPDSCIYLPATDTLVSKQYLINGIVRSLVVYRNFSKRLAPQFGGFPLVTSYTFDDSNPDYILRGDDGYQWPVGGFGASENGKWLAVEFRQRGIGLLNIETLEMRRISALALSYGTGADPWTEISVTNNGDTVAIMGMNSGLTVINVVPSCGETALDSRMIQTKPETAHCINTNIDPQEFINRFYGAYRPRFNSDGGELSFYASSYLGDMREVTLRAKDYPFKQLAYLALGDSFSSGQGETSDAHYINGTNDEFDKCHVSDRSYPYLIAHALQIKDEDFKSVACSGAVTEDVVGADLTYWGQGNRLGEGGSGFNIITKTLVQDSSLESFYPGRVKQISFVKKYQPKVITIGIGGNDIGFMDKLSSCVGIGTCEWAATTKGREKTALEVKTLFSTLVDTYTQLHDSSPQSKIYAVGYPKVIATIGSCSGITGIMLNADERQFMNEGIIYINSIILAASKAAGIKYLDIQDSLGDSVLCGTASHISMNGLRIGDDVAPIEKMSSLKFIGSETFHPKPLGHSMFELAIIGSVPNLAAYSYCAGVSTVCPDSSTAPYPSNYWLEDGITHGYETQRTVQYVQNRSKTNMRQKTLVLNDYTFASGSSVRAEIHSEPIVLGLFTADANGALRVDVDLPADLPEGYHTIHLYGTTYSGDSTDLYDVIRYELPVSNVVESSISKLGFIASPGSSASPIEPSMISSATGVESSTASSGISSEYDGSTSVLGVSNASDPDVSQAAAVVGIGRTGKISDFNLYIILALAVAGLVIVALVKLRNRK